MTPPVHILLLEDNPDDAELVTRSIEQACAGAFVLKRVASLAAATDALQGGTFSAVLADLGLKDSHGVSTVSALVAAAPSLPVIVLTGSERVDEEDEAIRAGAQDYLVKRESGGMSVARAIRHAIERQQLAEALRRANEELTAANRELEAFGYSVSHDLRGPLRSIDGFSAILAEDYGRQLPPEALTFIEQLRDASRRMNGMLTALMALSHIGGAQIEHAEISMAHLVRECLAELARDIEASGAEIVLGKLPDCRASRPLLKQALLNLIGNAVKYSRKARPPWIGIGSERKNGETVYFVRDNGVGFDMKHAGKLFGVFQRLHRADEFEGTGAGLAIVRRIILRHGGRVWAEAAPGEGATFRFTLGAE